MLRTKINYIKSAFGRLQARWWLLLQPFYISIKGYNSLFQRVNTVVLIDNGCTSDCHLRLHNLGIAFHPSRKPYLLKNIGICFMDLLVKALKSGSTLSATGDNFDRTITSGQIRKDRQNTRLHMFTTAITDTDSTSVTFLKTLKNKC